MRGGETYILDTNVIVTLILGSSSVLDCLRRCRAKYLIPHFAIDELLEHAEEIASKIGRKLNRKQLSPEDLVQHYVEVLTLLLYSLQLIDTAVNEEALAQAYQIIGSRDPDDVPIMQWHFTTQSSTQRKASIYGRWIATFWRN
ncbi:MAG: hypothetical protein J7L75_02230 [Thermoproteales archaeon]|nr:hypothetical protein [Thermoproteales archaeon]